MKNLLISLIIILITQNSNLSKPKLQKSNLTDETVKDIDGNTYHTVKIGSQIWLKENLKTTRYNNGDPIPKITDNQKWTIAYSGAYCDYLNDSINNSKYGCLYNWFCLSGTRNIAPKGYHVATDKDWETLIEYLGGAKIAGGKMKDIKNSSWPQPNKPATNESNFSALGCGYRNCKDGSFKNSLAVAWFWSSTDHKDYYYRKSPTLNQYNDEITMNTSHPNFGFSCRCVKD